MSKTRSDLDEILELDVDDITAAAGEMPAVRRRRLLGSSVKFLDPSEDDLTLFKALRFVQAALAVIQRGQLAKSVADPLTAVTVKLFDSLERDATLRFSALAILSLLAIKGRGLSAVSSNAILQALERARTDRDQRTRDLADNVLSVHGPVFQDYFRRLRAGQFLFGRLQPAVYDAARQTVYVVVDETGRFVRMATGKAEPSFRSKARSSKKKADKFLG